MTGIVGVLLNWNPLMKLDGYHMLCEIVGIQDLKEDSTAYVSAWVKSNIWRLPVEVPYVPKRRRSGIRSICLAVWCLQLLRFCMFSHALSGIFSKFQPGMGFHPGTGHRGADFSIADSDTGELHEISFIWTKRTGFWLGSRTAFGGCRRYLGSILIPLWRDSSRAISYLKPVAAPKYATSCQELYRMST